ncbi:MAG: hypothetical protein Q7T18_08635, partial [Sedimentisphaerales bacterium]|nr:hypothetical protein [Sedimentisphaerales bacterium]
MAANPFTQYLTEINKAYARGDSTEHTHRPALKTLIEALSDKITATNEPSRIKCGAPDLVISRSLRKLDQNIGYIETKDINANLNEAAKTDQIKKRYLPSLPNFILTDYIEFRWYINGEKKLTARLAEESAGKFTATDKSISDVQELLGHFLRQQPTAITSAKELAERMAHLARLLHDITAETFKVETERGQLHAQFDAFKKVLIHDLTADQFADMYAQTIAYGLFAARCHIEDVNVFGVDKYAAFHGMDVKKGELTREHAAFLLPKTNPFLRKAFGHIAGPDLDDRIAWLVDEIIALLRQARMDIVLKDFGKRTKRTDPVIHFYETFLAAYDSKLRETRGVYYTPEPVVSYIVRSVDFLLKEKFGLKQGLADKSKIKIPVKITKGTKTVETTKEFHKCLILDPATGTGTFLYEVLQNIYDTIRRTSKGAWPEYVRDHLLPRLFGFELMVAPYAIAHMKLGLALAETGYDFSSDERLRVFLTNTLQEAEEASNLPLFTQWLADEAREANEVKRDLPIMVVLGNPPYSGHSANASETKEFIQPGQSYSIQSVKGRMVQKTAGKNGTWIRYKTFIGQLLQDYYKIDGQPLGEKNPKWLQDDYVKFIRFAQWRIEQTGSGILAFITNHGYLDNPTFRGMRQNLMSTFSEIYILDLHGNAKKKETCPDGSEDKNVFDIQQGVSIGIFVKQPQSSPSVLACDFSSESPAIHSRGSSALKGQN